MDVVAKWTCRIVVVVLVAAAAFLFVAPLFVATAVALIVYAGIAVIAFVCWAMMRHGWM